jgi:hypothetical protein
MTIKGELHQLVDELDQDLAEEALAYLQTLRRRRVPGEASTGDGAGIEAEETVALGAWEDEGGRQAEHAGDLRSGERTTDLVPHDRREDLHHLVDELDEDSAVKALAYVRSLGGPRLLSEAGIDDMTGTEEEQADAVEAWQLDRRHALDER